MTTATSLRKTTHPPTAEGPSVYKLNVRQFDTMIDARVFPPETRVELLGGVIVEKMTRKPPHVLAVDRLDDLLRGLIPTGWVTRKEAPVSFPPDWQPEPDIAISRGPRERYGTNHPAAKDLALVGEICQSTEANDRGVKLQGYAAAKIPIYWIVDLSRRVVEVHSKPTGRGETARYRNSATFGPGEDVPVVIENAEVGKIAVDAFLP